MADEETKELKETKFWISGLINGKQLDCDGPYTTTKDIKTEYPITTVAPDPNLTYQKFDYIQGKWVDNSEHAYNDKINALENSFKSQKQAVQDLQVTVQKATKTSAENTDSQQKSINNLMKIMVQTNQNVGQIMNYMKAKEQPAQPTQPTQAINAEGGNK